MTKPYGGVIEGWYFSEVYNQSIEGNLFNDPNNRWLDGTHIFSSTIVKLDIAEGRLETLNTLYDLGERA